MQRLRDAMDLVKAAAWSARGLKGRTPLLLFITACVVGPAVAQLLIAYVPHVSKGMFEGLDALDSEAFYSVQDRREYELAYEPEVVVSGRILPGELADEVRLELNGDLYSGSLKVDGYGGFWAAVPLKEHANTVLALGPAGSRAAIDVFYLPGRDGESPPRAAREVTVDLSPGQASVTYVAVCDTGAACIDDLDLRDLQSGVIGADLFVKQVFYPASTGFSGRELSSLSAPSVALGGDTAAVTVRGILSDEKCTPENVSRILCVTPQPEAAGQPQAPTTITLKLEQSSGVLTRGPWPRSCQAGALQWIDPAQPITITYHADEGLGPEIQETLLRVSEAPELVWPLVPLIPFLWVLLSGRIRGSSGKTDQLRRTLYLLALCVWLVPIVGFVVPFAEIVHQGLRACLSLLNVYVRPLPGYPPELALWASSLTYCFLLFFAYRLSVRQVTATRARWLLLILGAFLLSVVFVFVEGYVPRLLFPAAALTLGVWAWLLSELYRPGSSGFSTLLGSWPSRIGLLVAIALVSYPISAAPRTFSPAQGWQLKHWAQFIFILGPFLLPYTVLVGLMPILRAAKTDRVRGTTAQRRRLLGRVIFASYVIGFVGAGLGSWQWLAFSFVPFAIAALWVYPCVVRGQTEWDTLRSGDAPSAVAALDGRPSGIAGLRRLQSQAGHASKEESESEGATTDASPGLPEDYDARRAIFAFGPMTRPWENAKLSCFYGSILSLIIFAVYFPVLLERARQIVNTPFPLLQILGVMIVPFFARWLLASFLLGYFFSHIRGANGLQKGLVLGLGIVVSTLPSNALLVGGTMADPVALLWDAGQTVLFLTILGLWAFDFNTARRYGLGGKGFLKAQGLSFMVPYLSSIAGAAGGVVQSILTGRAQSIMTSVLGLVLPGARPPWGGG